MPNDQHGRHGLAFVLTNEDRGGPVRSDALGETFVEGVRLRRLPLAAHEVGVKAGERRDVLFLVAEADACALLLGLFELAPELASFAAGEDVGILLSAYREAERARVGAVELLDGTKAHAAKTSFHEIDVVVRP